MNVLEITEGMVRLSCHQYKILAKNDWMEINVVTLHKVVETMPQQSVIKAKGGPMKY